MSDREMITPTQCGDLRLVILKLTCGRKITQDEYRQLCIVINKILSRMEKEEKQDGIIQEHTLILLAGYKGDGRLYARR